MKSISDFLRNAAVQYQLSKALEPFISEIGRTDPHLTKTTKEEMLKKSLDLLDKVTGHGLSEEKSLEIKAEINKMSTAREIFKYMSNLMLAGVGHKVVKESFEVTPYLTSGLEKILSMLKSGIKHQEDAQDFLDEVDKLKSPAVAFIRKMKELAK